MKLIPRDYQIEVDNSIWQFFYDFKEGNPIVGLPTGTGKSFSIAYFLEGVFKKYRNQHVLVLTHVKELIDQNYKELKELWPEAPAGIYSSGLKRKELNFPILFCGIQSIKNAVDELPRIDLILVDECHLISPDDETVYMQFIGALKTINPYSRVIGFTATPWRQGQGRLVDGNGLFTHMCIDLTGMSAFNRFLKEGYLKPLISTQTSFNLDVSKVRMRMGEFNEKQLQEAVNKDDITIAALKETILVAVEENRRHWLVFGSGIDHAIRITELLNHMGISARCVHSKMPEKERDQNILDWKAGKFTAMVNNGILTTGINFKEIDLIVMLRPTHSTILWVQMLGRGTRPVYAPGWDLTTQQGRLAAIANSSYINCRVMDFAGNCKRLGPINDPVIPRKKGEKTGEVPVKICDHCGTYNHIVSKYCGGEPFKTSEGCGAEFSFRVLLQETADNTEVIKDDTPQIQIFKVDRITFKRHQKIGKPDSVAVKYFCGPRQFTDFVLPEHPGGALRKAKVWWAERSSSPMPATVTEFLDKADSLLVPTHIKVWVNAPYPKIMMVSFTGAFQELIIGDEVPF